MKELVDNLANYQRWFCMIFFSQKCLNFCMWFSINRKDYPIIFCTGLLIVFKKCCMQKNSVFLAASFGDLLLHKKQKKSFVMGSITGLLFVLRKIIMLYAKYLTFPCSILCRCFVAQETKDILCYRKYHIKLSASWWCKQVMHCTGYEWHALYSQPVLIPLL